MRRVLVLLAAIGLVAVAMLPVSCAQNAPCTISSECPEGLYCAKGQCRRDCLDSVRDCDPGQFCNMITGKCQADGDASTMPDGSMPDGSMSDGTMMMMDTSMMSDGTMTDGGVGTKIELDLCANDGECKPNLICRALYKNGPTRCTRPCQNNTQCWPSARCMTIGNDQYCNFIDVGRTCTTQNPSACNWGCVSPGYCTQPCQSGLDCPNGYGCATVSNQKICVRAEQYCGNTTCTTLLCDQSGLVDSCTLNCSSQSDCPQRGLPLAGWTCNGTCKRPSDVFGPLAQGDPAEYACNGNAKVNLCNDSLHIDFSNFTIPSPPNYNCPVGMSVAGQSGDSCVDSCRFAGGCVHGYACTAVGNISNQRVGLCLPALGGGEVGTSCTKDGDCAFGYCASSKCSRDCTADGLCPTGSTCTNGGGPNVENLPFRRCQ